MPRYRIRYTVSFDTYIECEPERLILEVPDLLIPEDDQTRFADDTFEVDAIYLQQDNGMEVEVDEYGSTEKPQLKIAKNEEDYF